jgi:hypothetical protein
MKLDPENKLYWRMNRQRLDAEAMRDSLLAISGELTRDSGGPALVMEKAENCGALALKGVNPPTYTHKVPRPAQEFERTIYLPVFRNNFAGPDRLRGVFDFINPAMTAGERPQTIVPTQTLFLLSNDLIRKRAFALAKRTNSPVWRPCGCARSTAPSPPPSARKPSPCWRPSRHPASPPARSSGPNSVTACSPQTSSCFACEPFKTPTLQHFTTP